MSSDVLILAQNLRGFYLASELSGQGYNVTLLNLKFSTDEMIWSDNPFAYQLDDDLSFYQKEFLCGSSDSKIKEGLTYWLPDGPINLQSSFSLDIAKQKGLSVDEVETWAESSASTSFESKKINTLNANDFMLKNNSSYEVEKKLQACKNAGVEVLNSDESLKLIFEPHQFLVKGLKKAFWLLKVPNFHLWLICVESGVIVVL